MVTMILQAILKHLLWSIIAVWTTIAVTLRYLLQLALLLLFFFGVAQWVMRRWNKKILLEPKEPPFVKLPPTMGEDLREKLTAQAEELLLANKPLMILLTGCSGYVGRSILWELLCLLKKKEKDSETPTLQHEIYITVRAKRGFTAQERLKQLQNNPIFKDMQEVWQKYVVLLETGDMRDPNCGMADETLGKLEKAKITHIIHAAADVRFNSPLDEMAASNITVSLQLQEFARQWSNTCQGLVVLSTAFVSPDAGSKEHPIPENELINLQGYDPLDVYHSMLEKDSFAKQVKQKIGFANNYVMSKCIAEHLLLRDTTTPTTIVRPAIVGPALALPFAGWNGDQPSTVTAFALAVRAGLIRAFSINPSHTLAIIPVDVLTQTVLQTMFDLNSDLKIDTSTETSTRRPKRQKDNNGSVGAVPRAKQRIRIMNQAWPVQVVEPMLRFWAFAGVYTPSVTTIHILLIRFLCRFPQSVQVLSWLLNRLPLELWSFWSRFCGQFQVANGDGNENPDEIKPRKYIRMLGLLDEYSFVMKQEFHFESSSCMPPGVSSQAYLINSIAVAVENFLPRNLRQGAIQYESKDSDHNGSKGFIYNTSVMKPYSHINLLHPGRSDLWWALTQPEGSWTIRSLAFFVSKVLRLTCGPILMSMESLDKLSQMIAKQDSNMPICLAATHRSFLDFVLIPYLCFALPELGIQSPMVAASSRFQSLPLSFILEWAGAFYIEQGQQHDKVGLSERLCSHIVDRYGIKHWLVFLEGTRSRDRRFLPPKHGFLIALRKAASEAGFVDPMIVAPITLDYERVPEQAVFEQELTGAGKKRPLSMNGFISWMVELWDAPGDFKLGQIRISFAKPQLLDCTEEDFTSFTREIQMAQMSISTVTMFHLKAAKEHLDIPKETITNALRSLTGSHAVVSDESTSSLCAARENEYWSLHFQWLFRFAPLLRKSHPLWAQWLLPVSDNTGNAAFGVEFAGSDDDVKVIVTKIKEMLDKADHRAQEASEILQRKGIQRPSTAHMAATILDLEGAHSLLGPTMSWGAAFIYLGNRFPGNEDGDDRFQPKDDSLTSSAAVKPVFKSFSASNEEAVGRWGFSDSGFRLLPARKKGSRIVQFTGSRYNISGREFPTLLQFFEKSLQVNLDESPRSDRVPSSRAADWENEAENSEDSKLTAAVLMDAGFSEESVSTDVGKRLRHNTGHALEDVFVLQHKSETHRFPDVVVWPRSEEKCTALVKLAQQHDWCLIPYGGGTNVTHALRCPSKEIDPRPMVSVDMRRMNRIIWVNKEDGLAHVEAGIVGKDLVEELRKHGLTTGHEPDSIEFSTLGGWIATRASGMKKNRYGNIEDIVREVRLVTPSGVLSQNHHDAASSLSDKTAFGRTSIGTELKDLVIGSEGNIGIISSAVVRVFPLPSKREFSSVLFPDFDLGLQFVRDVARLQPSLRPSSVRLADNLQFSLSRELLGGGDSSFLGSLQKVLSKLYVTSWRGWNPESICACTLLFEGDGVEISFQKKLMQSLIGNHQGFETGAKNGSAGYDLTFAIAYLRDFALTQDILGESFETFVPWSCCMKLCEGVKKDVRKIYKHRCLPGKPVISCRITQLYKEGACVYFYLAFPAKGVNIPCQVFAELEEEARKSCLKHGGSLSHHHGVGKVRSKFLLTVNSPGLNHWLRQIKRGIDEQNIFGVRNGVLNHGKGSCNSIVKTESDNRDSCSTTPSILSSTGRMSSVSSDDSSSTPTKAQSDDSDTSDDSEEEVEAAFERAVKHVHQQSNPISRHDQARLYGLYKFVREGPCPPTLNRPGILQGPVAQAKYDAWKSVAVRMESQEEAQQEYVVLVESLFGNKA